MFYSNFNGREDYPCKKRFSPATDYDVQSDEEKTEENDENTV